MLLYKIMATSQNQMGKTQRTVSDFPTGILPHSLFKKLLVGSNKGYSQEPSHWNIIINVLC